MADFFIRKPNVPSLFEKTIESHKPRILFIGLSESSHARSFTELFVGGFDVRFFALPTYFPPNEWPVKTYISGVDPPANTAPNTRLCLYPTPEETTEYYRYINRRMPPSHFFRRSVEELITAWRNLYRKGKNPENMKPQQLQKKAISPVHWLVEIIQAWKPDIIHAFGVDAGIFLRDGWKVVIGDSPLLAVWVQQIRGASDITLRRYVPDPDGKLEGCLKSCDWIIGDNLIELERIVEMGIEGEKIASICPVPGTGGIDISDIQDKVKSFPKTRRSILWPKAYISPLSISLPVLEAIQIAWEKIQPCKIHMLAMDQGTRQWFYLLPEEIREHCQTYDRIPRDEALTLTAQSRVMLAPSLVDGVPNVLYEAMAAGALPIVSQLDTIQSVVSEENVLFTENMNPQAIADALVLAMNDDELVTEITTRNYDLVKDIANRDTIKKKVVSFYKGIIQ